MTLDSHGKATRGVSAGASPRRMDSIYDNGTVEGHSCRVNLFRPKSYLVHPMLAVIFARPLLSDADRSQLQRIAWEGYTQFKTMRKK